MNLLTKAKQNTDARPGYGTYLFLVVCIWTLTFEEPVTHLGFPGITLFRNALPILAIIYFIADPYGKGGSKLHTLTSPTALLGFIFAAAGMAGWLINNYQTYSLTVQAMYEHLRFWICIWAFFSLFSDFPLRLYARKLFCHVGVLSAVFISLSAADMLFHIWPRQIYRYGIGSIQLFFGHPSNYGAHCVFLLAMLCLLVPFLNSSEGAGEGRLSEEGSVSRSHAGGWTREAVIASALAAGMLCLVVATLRTRLIGFTVFFVILFIFMIVMKKRLHPGILIVGFLAAFAVGWRRIYFFYFSAEAFTMARGQFATNSLDIAKVNFPFGAGFGTFGSRIAQIHYSPLYYKYHMMVTTGLSPTRPSYACDSFYPMILGESGWLGFAAYILMIVLLIVLIFRLQKAAGSFDGIAQGRALSISRMAVFTAFILMLYELSETTGTLAFSETYSVAIAIALGLALRQIVPPEDSTL